MSEEMQSPDAERLVELLQGELGYYQQLLDLARKQSEFVAAGDMEALMPLLGQKQQLIDNISVIEEELKPAKANWIDMEISLEGSIRKVAASLIEKIEEVLGQIVALERSVEETLQSARKDVMEQMASLKDKSRAAKAYGGKPSAQGGEGTRFFDQKK